MSNLGTGATAELQITTTIVSRAEVEDELATLGINSEFFKTLTVDQLSDLLFGLNKVVTANAESAAAKRIEKRFKSALSPIDKKILKALLESWGSPSSLQLSRELDIPISTVQRRRKRLEEEFVKESYSLQYQKFGRRQVTFIVSIGVGNKTTISDEILELEKVIAVTRTFGDSADLKIEALVESNQEFMAISEKIRSISGIQKFSWFESLEELGRKKEVDVKLIESA